MEGSLANMDEIYQAARQAHDKIFLAEPTGHVTEKFEKFKNDYNVVCDNSKSNSRGNNDGNASKLEVDLNGLSSLARILLIRMIVQQLVEDFRKKTAGIFKVQKTIFYKVGEEVFECDHKPGNSPYSQPANFYLHGIGRYSEVEPELARIANQSSFVVIASKIRASRTRGIPIVSFDELEQEDVNFLNRFVFLQDMEVVRRLFRERDENEALKKEPSNELDQLPVGVAMATVSNLMRRKDSTFDFRNTGFFNVFSGQKAERKCSIRKIISGQEKITVDGMMKLLEDEFGQSSPDYPKDVESIAKCRTVTFQGSN